MDTSNEKPRFLSLVFHLNFFPSLLWRQLRQKGDEYQPSFSNHVPIEFTVLTVVSIAAGAFGFVSAFSTGSATGWIFGIAGLGIFLALLIKSIHSEKGHRPSFENFRTAIFLFFIFLGITIGLTAGIIYQLTFWQKILTGTTGLFAGYTAGIFAGLHIQRLGWIGRLFDVLALAAIAGMVILDIVMLI
jgi:tryptophan-rich sensory protein